MGGNALDLARYRIQLHEYVFWIALSERQFALLENPTALFTEHSAETISVGVEFLVKSPLVAGILCVGW